MLDVQWNMLVESVDIAMRIENIIKIKFCDFIPAGPWLSLMSLKEKVDVQNNILHTLREASYVGKKNNFMSSSFLAPLPLEIFGP